MCHRAIRGLWLETNTQFETGVRDSYYHDAQLGYPTSWPNHTSNHLSVNVSRRYTISRTISLEVQQSITKSAMKRVLGTPHCVA
jgi:hypothetical protein